MKRWTAIEMVKEESRWQALSEALKASGCENEFVPWTTPLESLDVAQLDSFDHVRLGPKVAPPLLKQVKVQSTWATLIGVVDGMTRVDGGWWPLCALYEAFGQVLIRIGQRLDMRGSVMIAEAGGVAQVAVAAFFRAGFKNFLVSSIDPAAAEELIHEVRGKMFGLEIEFVPLDKIVLLPGDSTVIVNCSSADDDSPLVNELSYLNFLKRPGFLFDTHLHPKRSLLAREAADSSVEVVDGIELAARSDVMWAKWAFAADLDSVGYQERLTKALGEVSPAKS